MTTTVSIPEPKEPRTQLDWTRGPDTHVGGFRIQNWTSGPIRVCSSLDMAELPGGNGNVGPQWHISISHGGTRRPKPHHVRRALRAFGMTEAEQDSHHPGNAVHYFLPVDPAYRVNCECKATEDTIIESDGYRWTNPKPDSGEACRGCIIAPMVGRPCPIHGGDGHP